MRAVFIKLGKFQGGVLAIQSYEDTIPSQDECQFFMGSGTTLSDPGDDMSDQFHCHLFSDNPSETTMTEIRPVDKQIDAVNVTYNIMILTLPSNNIVKLGVRRITLEGGFFGTNSGSEVLDVEVCNGIKISCQTLDVSLLFAICADVLKG